MAIDPRILAALSAGSKISTSSSVSDESIEEWKKGQSGAGTKGAWNLGQGIIDVLSTGGYATAGLTNKLGQNIAAVGRGELTALTDLINPFSNAAAAGRGVAERRTYSENLKELGVGDKVAPWLGLALDIGLDPTTYITGGTIAAVKGATQGAKLATKASKAGETISKTGVAADSVVALNRPLTQSETLGNLLTGISRGYQTGKLNQKATLAGSKVARMSTRKARKLDIATGSVTISSRFRDATKAADKLDSRIIKASPKAAAKAKRAADEGLPGIEAGKVSAKRLAAQAAQAAKAASKATDETVAVITSASQGKHTVEIRNAEGIIANQPLIGKTFSTVKKAEEAATKAVADIKTQAEEGIYPDIVRDANTPGAQDSQLQEAIRNESIAKNEIRSIRSELAGLSTFTKSLNDFAKTVSPSGAYNAGLKPAAKDLPKLTAQVQARIKELGKMELESLSVSSDALTKLTTAKLFAIMKKPASERTVQEQNIFEEIARQEVPVPAEFNELAAEIGRVLDSEGIAILTKSDGTTSRIKTVTKEQRTLWASDINADPAFKARLRENAKALSNAQESLARAEKQLDLEAAKYQKLVEALSVAGKSSSAAATKQSDKIRQLADDIDQTRVTIERYKQGETPGGEGKFGWWTSTQKIVADDYFPFVNKIATDAPELDIAGIQTKLIKPSGKAAPKPQTEKAPNISPENRARLTEISRALPTASKIEKEALLAERATISSKTELPSVEVADLPPITASEKGGTISRSGMAETTTMAMLARMSNSRMPAVKDQAKLAFEDGRDALVDAATQKDLVNKPWIDGIVTANDAGEASKAFIRFAAPELSSLSPVFRQATKMMEDALEGRLKAVSGGQDVALSSDEVAQVFEEFLSGRDFTKITDDLGRLDLNQALEPAGYGTIEELATDLADGKTLLTVPQLASLSKALGVPVNNVDAARTALTNHTDSITSLLGRQDEMGKLLSKSIEIISTPSKVPITTKMVLQATGDSNGAVTARAMEEVTDPNQIIAAADEVAAAVRAGEPANLTPAFSSAAEAAAVQIRERETVRLMEMVQEIGGASPTKTRLDLVNLLRDTVFSDLKGQIAAIAAKRGESLEELLDTAIRDGFTVLTEDPEVIKMTGAFRAGELSSESRFGLYAQLGMSPAAYKSGGSPTEIFARENRKVGLLEQLSRSMGLPVTSTENYAATLRRVGASVTGEKLEKGVTGLRSNITYMDIARSLMNAGKTDLFNELRKYRGKGNSGYGQGNFPPSAIESAWLTVKDLISNGKTVTKGSPEFDEALFVLSKVYQKPGAGAKTTGIPVDQLFVDSFQTRAAKILGGDQAKEINKASEDLIEFLSDNFGELSKLDADRTVAAGAKDSKLVYEKTSKLMLGMLQFSMKYSAMKNDAVGTGTFLTQQASDYFGGLVKEHNDLLETLSTGKFHDPEVARFGADITASVMMNASIKGAKGSSDTSTGMPALRQEISNELSRKRSMDEAMSTAKKAGKDPVAAGKNARRVQHAKEIEEKVAIMAEVAAKSPDLTAELANTSELTDVAMRAEVMNTEFAKTSGKVGRLSRAKVMLSGKEGMGGELKTLLVSGELVSISATHDFSQVLRAIGKAYRGREEETIEAFSALQKYASETAAAKALGELAPTVDEFLTASKITVDRELFDVFEQATNMLFGNDQIYGAAMRSGAMSAELNAQLQRGGLNKFRFVDGEEAVEADGFWTRLDIQDENMSPLEFLDKVNVAVHRASGQVAIGSSLHSQFARSGAEILAAGEKISDYAKIDPEDTIGKIIGPTDKLFPKEIIERLRYVNQYMNYEIGFGEGSLNSMVQLSDRIVNVLKGTQTVLRPGHWVTTVLGEAAMSALAGVHISSYAPAVRLLRQRSPGQYGKDFEGTLKAYAARQSPKGMQLKAGEFDNVWWITNGKREMIPDEILDELADRNGMLLSPINPGIEDFLMGDQPLVKGAFGQFNKMIGKLSPAAAARDNVFRMSHFIHELRTNTGAKSLEEAASIAASTVREWRPTVGSLSAFERKYARRAVYFYVWQRIALTKVIATAMEKPGLATVPSKIQYALADYNGFNPESFGDPWDPDAIYASWHTGELWGPQFAGPQGPQDAWGFQPAIQPIDVVNQISRPFTIQPGENPLTAIQSGAGDLLSANLNPVVKTLIEAAAQSRLGPGGDLPGVPEYLLNQIGVVSTISKVSGLGQDPDPFETEQDRQERNSRLLNNLFLGQRITDYSTPGSEYKWRMDQAEILKRMTGQ